LPHSGQLQRQLKHAVLSTWLLPHSYGLPKAAVGPDGLIEEIYTEILRFLDDIFR